LGIKIFNTLTGKKEEFIPREKGKVYMYVCGPTVYNHIHIGNAHSYLIFDVIKRYLIYKGYKVIHVQNITDIEDRIINQSIEENLSATDISRKYEPAFWKVSDKLNILRPDFSPKATEHIDKMIEMIKVLIDKGYAYVSNGSVYFAIEKFKSYGKLSKKNITELIEGNRASVVKGKRNPYDFALWKASKPGEPSWNTPWGEGRPGWHIECSAMSLNYLGMGFDIHGGGKDLIFPHHENEIAQSEAYSGSEPFVRYWIHNGFINIDKVKMSKSLKNWVFAKDVLEMYDPNVVRIMSLNTHYRNDVNYSPRVLKACNQAHEKLLNTIHDVNIALSQEEQKSESYLKDEILHLETGLNNLKTDFEDAMDDDFNTARALSFIFKFLRELNKVIHLQSFKLTPEIRQILINAKSIIIELTSVLGLDLSNKKITRIAGTIEAVSQVKGTLTFEQKLEDELNNMASKIYKKVVNLYPQDATELSSSNISKLNLENKIKAILSLRSKARERKNWDFADSIRKMLKELGISIKDTASGTKWRFS